MGVVKNIIKTVAAGVAAMGILSGMFAFYYLQPAHIDNTEGNTDYVWISSSRWFKLTEGISWGRFDADGYNNAEVVENPDIIVLGSSHMEATNVVQGQDTAALLGKKLEGQYSVYNMGISGHHFLKVCQYLPQNLARYAAAPKAVIIETDNLTFTAAEIEAMLQGNIAKSPSYSTGIIAMSQKSPFLSAMYYQLQGGIADLFMPDKAKFTSILRSVSTPPLSALKASTPFACKDVLLSNMYSQLFSYLGSLQEQYGTQLIIFYHPTGTLQSDGSVKFANQDIKEEFIYNCEEQNIQFIDMTDSFYAMYEQQHKLPHGFVTGVIGSGHLNADGHSAIAEALYQKIIQLEADGIICR